MIEESAPDRPGDVAPLVAMADAPRPVPDQPVAVDADVDGGTTDVAPALSWAEQETLDALKRLAGAQSQLQALEDRASATPPAIDPTAGSRLEQIHAEVVAARAKASGRFARGAARDRLEQLEMNERLVLDQVGVADYEAYRRLAAAAAAPGPDPVDPQVLAFARQELASAQQAWLEVAAMEVPEVEEPDEIDGLESFAGGGSPSGAATGDSPTGEPPSATGPTAGPRGPDVA